MMTVREIQRAFEGLSLADREQLAAWVSAAEFGGRGVEERAVPYAAGSEFVSVEQYLDREEQSDVRHEYINGAVYAMFGPSEPHAVISGNLFAAIHAHARGTPCRAFVGNFKVRIEMDDANIFYYPDVMVSCTRDGVDLRYLRYPKLIVEVLSPSTESIDRREKLISYKQIPTLGEYALLSQKAMQLTMYRRANQWRPHVVSGVDATAQFDSIDLALPLAQIYERVSLEAA